MNQIAPINRRSREIPRAARIHHEVKPAMVSFDEEPTVGGGVADVPCVAAAPGGAVTAGVGVALTPRTNSGEMTNRPLAGAAVATTVRLPAMQARVTVVVVTPDALVVVEVVPIWSPLT